MNVAHFKLEANKNTVFIITPRSQRKPLWHTILCSRLLEIGRVGRNLQTVGRTFGGNFLHTYAIICKENVLLLPETINSPV